MKIKDPLSRHENNRYPIQSVLRHLAGQEGCDGEPYDQMQQASEYIDDLEAIIHKQAELLCEQAELSKQYPRSLNQSKWVIRAWILILILSCIFSRT